MKVLVVGAGGREHAIAWKLSQSNKLTELFVAPGNAGTASFATNIEISSDDLGALALWAVQKEIDLTIVGPEAPLAAGIVDIFTGHGLRIFGPTKEAAQMESSKAFAKEIMRKAGVKTPEGEEFDNFEDAKAYLDQKGAPIVIKADGLAAGKGVVVAQEYEEALEALKMMMLEGTFGGAGKKVVIEECIIGREASVMAMIEGDTILPLVISQDYKCLMDNDEGPNTGGMGAISPTPVLDDSNVAQLVDDIFVPVVKVLRNKRITFTGFLYAGIIVDAEGVIRVLEFNCRLGDPETQVLMMRLESDLLDAFDKAVKGQLCVAELHWTPQSAACIVASSRGYPKEVDDGKVVRGLYEADAESRVFHAGTTLSEDGEVITKGGRVLAVSALGKNADESLQRAFNGINRISFDGMHYRSDIGKA